MFCLFLEVQSEEEDEDYRPHWELHWKVTLNWHIF